MKIFFHHTVAKYSSNSSGTIIQRHSGNTIPMSV